MRLVIDVQPHAPGPASLVHRSVHDPSTDSLAAQVGDDRNIEEESVDVAVPGDVGEPDEAILNGRRHPPQAAG